MGNILCMSRLGSRWNAAKEQISELKDAPNKLSQKALGSHTSLKEEGYKLEFH